MSMINYIELDIVMYYGDHFDVCLFEKGDYMLEHYRKSKNGNYLIDNYGEGITYYFLFEDNAKSFSEALNTAAHKMKKEGLDPHLNYKDVADLAKLIADVNLGEELYLNFKINLQYYNSIRLIAFEKRLKGFDDLLSHKAVYCSGNSVCFFGNENMMDLIQKPEEFKSRLLKWSFNKNLVDVLKFLGVSDEEISSYKFKAKEEKLINKISSLEIELESAKQELKDLRKEVKENDK